jgi:TPR repeat protein
LPIAVITLVEVPAMSLLRWKRSPSETEALLQEVGALKAALLQCRRVVRDWTGVRRWLTVVVAAMSLTAGYALGLYHEPLAQRATELVRTITAARAPRADAAYAAYDKGNYRAALPLLRPLAEQGDARAQALLGTMYAGGRGVPRDDSEAVRWLRLAADQEEATAQLQLGVMYVKGYGVPQDYDEAARWYRLAAEQGNPQAQFDLALLYVTGEGVPQSYVSAHMWLNLAAAHFPAKDGLNRRMAAANREFVESRMTREQITEAQRLAREWRSK